MNAPCLTISKLPDRFWNRVTGDGALDCWLWTGGTDTRGYGQMRWAGRMEMVHRLSYAELVVDLPSSLCLDHLCRTPLCVNPWHLEPVTKRVNNLRGLSPWAENARKLTCPQGHEYYGETNYRGSRICRECANEQNRQWRARKKLKG